ncbi:hypothetical protein [Clostridium botulinum]|uniref:hypothetical protein n=1 Tax=Clostridium botulinum TaxID=1491 RepID=UPI0006AC23EB|nr:hypothetical protein [Clostridium botulinum]KOR54877.1 hypothetical protein ADT23_00350 [Clostridium botulinum]MBD5587615.1 hypothetical protein [Clostridium botulinum]MBY6839605.1 hypothetical protein [Clostridium botulinum]MCR1163750.1 hypothetical protein [Clostridium botulinum]
MGKLIDLAGNKYGRLTVIEKYGIDYKSNLTKWKCLCECGNETVVYGVNLRKGKTKSCGCLNKDIVKARMTKHNLFGTRIYKVWADMLQRCNNPKNPYYDNYGGRGIKVCDKWIAPENFVQWAFYNGYNENLTIDRIDVNANYSPENCRWITIKKQQNNRRNNILFTIKNKTKTLAEWCKEYNMNYGAVYYRIKKGWNIEKALTTPTT